MRRARHRLSAGLLTVLLAGCASAPHSLDTPAGYSRTALTSITHAADNAARRDVASQQLRALGLEVHPIDFNADGLIGTNLLADVSGSPQAPHVLIGAHLDRVDQGMGAVDNASGVVVAMALAQRLKARPLRHHRVSIALWDLEEKGLLGARAYVNTTAQAPALYINLDVFAWGDTLWMMSPEPNHPLALTSAAASQAASLGFVVGERYPPSDHLAFLSAG